MDAQLVCGICLHSLCLYIVIRVCFTPVTIVYSRYCIIGHKSCISLSSSNSQGAMETSCSLVIYYFAGVKASTHAHRRMQMVLSWQVTPTQVQALQYVGRMLVVTSISSCSCF